MKWECPELTKVLDAVSMAIRQEADWTWEIIWAVEKVLRELITKPQRRMNWESPPVGRVIRLIQEALLDNFDEDNWMEVVASVLRKVIKPRRDDSDKAGDSANG